MKISTNMWTMQTILNLCIADKELSKEELRNKYDACAQD
jgi:hypothetical protein